ncbi:hypothetical protein BC829DRAFT_235239 [Chytridium lagenaria]|nr:hypothetical protein BC829DRAFT_235239 [Chytridium lagenaria]
MHGLGIISSWYQWLSTDTLLPGYPMLTPMSASNGFTPLTLSKGYIFDKFIFDSRGKVWMRDYADAIRMEFEKLGKEIWPPNTPASALSWSDPRANNLTENFMRTDGWKLATYIRQVVTRTPRGLTFWYPAPSIRKRKGGSRANNVSGRWRYVVLYTPLDYSGGSSISHVDALLYYGTAQYLMRPFGSAGTSTDSFSPQEKYGPVGEALLGMLRALGYATALGPLNFVP